MTRVPHAILAILASTAVSLAGEPVDTSGHRAGLIALAGVTDGSFAAMLAESGNFS